MEKHQNLEDNNNNKIQNDPFDVLKNE